MMQPIFEKLYRSEYINHQESRQLFNSMLNGQLANSQLAAALISMKMRGEHPEEIAGAASVFLENALFFPRPDYDFADIVGTGGDGLNSLNISTASAFVAAACGLKIAKHGNRGVSSRSGSSDFLDALGIPLDLSPAQSRQALDEIGLCFLFAPQYHTGFRQAIDVRQQLQTRTLFNIIGPLINPARPPFALIGVYSPDLLLPLAETLLILGYRRAAVVHGSGLDEVAIHGTTQVAELINGKIDYYSLHPSDFGLPLFPIDNLLGGTATENQHLLKKLLKGQGTPAQVAAIAANVALLLKIFGHENLSANATYALEKIQQGSAYYYVTALANRSK